MRACEIDEPLNLGHVGGFLTLAGLTPLAPHLSKGQKAERRCRGVDDIEQCQRNLKHVHLLVPAIGLRITIKVASAALS